MKEYLEINNADDKRLPMICVSERSNAMSFASTDIRRQCVGLPIIRQFKVLKVSKYPYLK